MRLPMIRAGLVATAALFALAACSGTGMTPSSPSGSMQQVAPNEPAQQAEPNGPIDGAVPVSSTDRLSAGPVKPLGVTTCDTSPPQYQWLFKGACEKITLKPAGASFSLGAYDNITIKGSIGKNNVKTTATVYIADATGNGGDIETWKGHAFNKYKGKGTTFVYAVAINQGKSAIKPIAEKNKPILQYVITDSKGLPGKTCAAAVLTTGKKGSLVWAALPGTFQAKGDTVTISQYNVPAGFELPGKTPLYFGVNCF